MAWQTPKTNWGQSGQTVPIADDFNRIEGNIQHLQDTKETPAGAQAKANTAETNAKAYTDAHEQKAAPHSGHETPAGAQAKAEAAAGAVQADLDTHKADYAFFKESKGQPNGLATLDASGKVPLTQAGNAIIASGTYSGNDTSPRTINVGFTPKMVFISNLNETGSEPLGTILFFNNTGVVWSGAIDYFNRFLEEGQTRSDWPYGNITTNGFVVKSNNNFSGKNYGWVAIA